MTYGRRPFATGGRRTAPACPARSIRGHLARPPASHEAGCENRHLMAVSIYFQEDLEASIVAVGVGMLASAAATALATSTLAEVSWMCFALRLCATVSPGPSWSMG